MTGRRERTFADLGLARRLEALVAEEMRRFALTACGLDEPLAAEALEIAGGIAVHIPGAPALNQAVGLGFDGPVTEHHLEEIERFYTQRGVQPAIAVCPLAHPTLIESLACRGWTVDGFENVLVREASEPVRPTPESPAVVIEVESDEERDVWGAVAATGFAAPLDPSAEQLMLCGLVSMRPETRLYLALIDGRPAGTGELYIADGVAWLSADATLPQFRGRGVQTALQAHRINVARAAECELVVSEAAPGGPSQRNMHRHGFEVAYTRADFTAVGGYARPERIEGSLERGRDRT